MGEPLTWEKLKARRAFRVSTDWEGSIDDPPEALASHRARKMENLIKLDRVFGPLLG